MKLFAIFTMGIFFPLAFTTCADAGALLREITKEESLSATQLKLSFSELPAYRLETSGQRVDLFLTETEGDSTLTSLPEDGKVVRILLGQQKKALMASFLLRTVPQSVKVLTNQDAAQLVLDLSWPTERVPGRLAIASRLSGAPRVRSNGAALTLGGQQGYLDHWQPFFQEDAAALRISIPLTYTLCPLPRLLYQPLIGGSLGEELLSGVEFAQQEHWAESLTLFQRIPEASLQGVDREAFLVLKAEALVRLGKHAEAQTILEVFCEEFATSAMLARARYLLSYVSAVLNRPYVAVFQLSLLSKEAEDKAYYIQIGYLLQAEIELSVGRQDKTLEILEGQPFPSVVALTRERRLGDALALSGRYDDALQRYSAVEKQTKIWVETPSSLALMAETLYQEKDYHESVVRYTELLNQVNGDEQISLTLFAQGRGLLRAGNVKEATIRLREVTSYWPGTEGSQRAQLLLLDQSVLADPGALGQQAVPLLSELAENGLSRDLREEAAFKRLLLKSLQQANLDAVTGCETFFNQFGQGRYRSHAEGLLSEILPQVIRDQIAKEDYLSALVLVEKHRQRLLAGATNQDFLLDLCAAFRRLGLLDKAAKVYFYLLDAYSGQPAEAAFYLPLVQVLSEQRDVRLTLEYADRYVTRYPSGQDLDEILRFKIAALHAEGRNEEAAKILTSVERTKNRELDLLAGKVFWALGQPAQVKLFLAPVLNDSRVRKEAPDAVILLAEALFQLQDIRQAWPLYQELLPLEVFSDQARYRSAQILLIQGQKAEALNFLRILVEEGKSPQWQKMAASALLSEQTDGL